MSKLSITSIRSFLERNKVIFETVATLFVSITAVLVSYCQLHISKVQTNLQVQQTNISKLSILPHFVIRLNQLKNPEFYYEDEITVENDGSDISKFLCKNVVLLDVELINRNSSTEKRLITFYLNGYYSSPLPSSQGQGLLTTIKGYQNDQKYSDFEHSNHMRSRTQNEYLNTTLRRFLHITYIDQIGDNHSEYYYVPRIDGASRVDEEEGKVIFSGYTNSIGTKKFIEFDKLSAESLYDLVVGK